MMANGFIGLINGRRTIRSTTVAETRVAATIVVPALVSKTEITFGGTARTLKRGKQTEPSKLHHVVRAVRRIITLCISVNINRLKQIS